MRKRFALNPHTVTNVHLTQYQPDGNINVTRGIKISGYHCALLCETEWTWGRILVTPKVDKVLMATISELYYDEGSQAGFSTLRNLRAAEVIESKKVKPQSVATTRAWL